MSEQKSEKQKQSAAREARIAKALRDNLRRRKQAARKKAPPKKQST